MSKNDRLNDWVRRHYQGPRTSDACQVFKSLLMASGTGVADARRQELIAHSWRAPLDPALASEMDLALSELGPLCAGITAALSPAEATLRAQLDEFGMPRPEVQLFLRNHKERLRTEICRTVSTEIFSDYRPTDSGSEAMADVVARASAAGVALTATRAMADRAALGQLLAEADHDEVLASARSRTDYLQRDDVADVSVADLQRAEIALLARLRRAGGSAPHLDRETRVRLAVTLMTPDAIPDRELNDAYTAFQRDGARFALNRAKFSFPAVGVATQEVIATDALMTVERRHRRELVDVYLGQRPSPTRWQGPLESEVRESGARMLAGGWTAAAGWDEASDVLPDSMQTAAAQYGGAVLPGPEQLIIAGSDPIDRAVREFVRELPHGDPTAQLVWLAAQLTAREQPDLGPLPPAAVAAVAHWLMTDLADELRGRSGSVVATPQRVGGGLAPFPIAERCEEWLRVSGMERPAAAEVAHLGGLLAVRCVTRALEALHAGRLEGLELYSGGAE